MKGIVLAGGAGTRLHPLTQAVSKQLLPIYDKPMIYYPVSVLMLAGIRDILLVTTPEDAPSFKRLMGDGSQYGINISYVIQPTPGGLPQAFTLGADFIGKDPVALVLGDNIFYGQDFVPQLQRVSSNVSGGTIFAYKVSDPERYGVVEFDKQHKILSIEEKPQQPRSNYAITGLYFFDNQVVEIAKNLKPSARGELEIADVMKAYLQRGQLNLEFFGRGFAWLDTGTHDSMLDASVFVSIIEKRQGLKVACLEEIAWHQGWLNDSQLRDRANALGKSGYGQYLSNLMDEKARNDR